MTVNVMRSNVVGSQGKWPYIRKNVVTQILIMKTKDITSTGFATFLWQSKATAGHAMRYGFCVPFSILHLIKPACFQT